MKEEKVPGNLEEVLNNQYKSEGERKIAMFFEQYGVPFVYEKPTLVTDSGKQRIWYPDFTTYGSIVLEYFGLQGNNDNYDNGIEHKKRIYRENHLDFVPVYPAHLRNGWQDYIVSSIGTILENRKKEFNEAIQKNQQQFYLPFSNSYSKKTYSS